MNWSLAPLRALAACLAVTALSTISHDASADGVPSYADWQADVKEAVGDAVPYLQDRLAQGGSGLAIVLDIDNTALETDYRPGRANRPVLDVARWASNNGYAIVFVSYRGEGARGDTIDELQSAGYPVDELCLRRGSAGKAESKQRCRRELSSAGYTITANIGNRATDLEGGDYERGFKLPDYDGQLQ